jgi:hypothetical protein
MFSLQEDGAKAKRGKYHQGYRNQVDLKKQGAAEDISCDCPYGHQSHPSQKDKPPYVFEEMSQQMDSSLHSPANPHDGNSPTTILTPITKANSANRVVTTSLFFRMIPEMEMLTEH